MPSNQHSSGEEQSSPGKPSLYERLGGAYRIAMVVDDFIERIMSDERLEANPRVREANRHLSRPGLKYLVTELACWAAGGPQTYSGRGMAESHRHLMISDQEWRWFIDDFRASLAACGVRPAEGEELTAMLEASKREIVR